MDDKKTMTAEEVERVERAERTLKHALTAWSGDERDRAENALSRLAAQAARVPGLEKELAGATANFDRAASAAAESAKAHGLEIKRREQAESDRDEWRRRALGAEAERSDLAAKHLAALSERDAARERVVVLEQSERDLGGHVANLEKVLAAERESLRLSRENVTTLRERVATLEDERVASDASHRDTERALAAQRDTLEGCLEGAKAREDAVRERADTAESRVRELEAPSRALRDLLAAIHAYPRGLHSGDEDSTEHDEDCEGCLVEALKAMAEEVASVQVDASHPAPATGVADRVRLSDDEVERMRKTVQDNAATGRTLSTDDLLRLMDSHDALSRAMSPTPPPGLREAVEKLAWVWRETMRRHGRGMLAFPATYGEMETLLAAVAAAKGGEPPVQGKPSILGALTGLGRALRANSGGIHTLVTLEVSREHYDAVACGLVGHEYTRVFADRIHCETGEVPVRIVNKSLTLATPPSGPGGRETKPDPIDELQGLLNEAGLVARIHPERIRPSQPSTRARIAPTPTPEVPPLKPEPPAVIWQTDGIRVSGSGDAYVEVSGGSWLYLNDDRFQSIARALAEAKTDARLARASLASSEEALRQTDKALAEAKRETAPVLNALRQYQHRDERCLTETLTRLVDERVTLPQKAWREAAESMRERAEELAYTHALKTKDLAARDRLMSLGHYIRDLPLE